MAEEKWAGSYSNSCLRALWQHAFLISRPASSPCCFSKLVTPSCLFPHICISIRSSRGFNLARQRNKAWALIRKVLTRTTRQASRNSARLLLMRWHIWSGGFTWLFEKVFRPSLPRFLTDTAVQGVGGVGLWGICQAKILKESPV